jgi:hypothetical protein
MWVAWLCARPVPNDIMFAAAADEAAAEGAAAIVLPCDEGPTLKLGSEDPLTRRRS